MIVFEEELRKRVEEILDKPNRKKIKTCKLRVVEPKIFENEFGKIQHRYGDMLVTKDKVRQILEAISDKNQEVT